MSAPSSVLLSSAPSHSPSFASPSPTTGEEHFLLSTSQVEVSERNGVQSRRPILVTGVPHSDRRNLHRDESYSDNFPTIVRIPITTPHSLSTKSIIVGKEAISTDGVIEKPNDFIGKGSAHPTSFMMPILENKNPSSKSSPNPGT